MPQHEIAAVEEEDLLWCGDGLGFGEVEMAGVGRL
jgi:hypothetical protein